MALKAPQAVTISESTDRTKRKQRNMYVKTEKYIKIKNSNESKDVREWSRCGEIEQNMGKETHNRTE